VGPRRPRRTPYVLPASLVAAHRRPDLVRRSLWFDKTSIRSGGEPERLPYTVYDLPLAPPPPGGQPGRVR